MRKNNAGLTLVELLVSMTILGIIIVAAFGFMVSGSNIFKSVETRKNLRMEAQLAVNLIESYIIDCNENIYFDGTDSLFVINSEHNSEANETYSAHVFKLNSVDNILTYAETSADKGPDGSYSYSSGYTEDLICGNVENFSVTSHPSEAEGVSYVELELSLEKGGVSQGITKTIALRNKVTTKAVN